MSARVVTERKRRLTGPTLEFACRGLHVEPGRRAVLRYDIDRDLRFEATGLFVPKGAMTIGHYWHDRPYNVYHWLQDGRTLAYYCNVAAETVIGDDLVEYLDLAVDVLLDPAGTPTVLDEDELPDDLAPPLRAIVSRAVEELTSGGRRLGAELERESRPYLMG